MATDKLLTNEKLKKKKYAEYTKPHRLAFQQNATDKLCEILKDSSRAFLSDEAGLGKTYSATGVIDKMAEKHFDINHDEPFIVLYVAPNTALLKKNCDDIIAKSESKYEIIIARETLKDTFAKKYHNEEVFRRVLKMVQLKWPSSRRKEITDENIENMVNYYRKNKGKVKENTLVIDSIDSQNIYSRSTNPIYKDYKKYCIYEGKYVERLTEAYRSYENFYKNKKSIILVPISINLLAVAGESFKKSEQKWIDGFLNSEIKSKIKKDCKEIDVKKIAEICNVNKGKLEDEDQEQIYRDKCENIKKLARCEWEILWNMKPKLVIYDEYHRYFEKVSDNITNSLIAYEKEIKALFLSATPYKTNISDSDTKDVLENLAEDDQSTITNLPSFEDFARIFFGNRKCKNEAKNDLIKFNEDYLEKLQNLLQIIKKEKKFNKEWKKAKKARKDLQDILSSKMIRHERRNIEGFQERHDDILKADIKDEKFKKCLQNTYRQIIKLKELGYEEGALKWSMNMPWILSFSSFHKKITKRDKPKQNKKYAGYYDVLYPSASLDKEKSKDYDSLFLYRDEKDTENDKIKDLPKKNLAFYQMTEANLKDRMSQLLWVPASRPLYKVGENSIFKTYERYSKLLVFGEYRYLQRGGSVLLSQYAEYKNRLGNGAKSSADKVYNFKLNYAEFLYEFEVLKNKEFDIYSKKDSNKDLSKLVDDYTARIKTEIENWKMKAERKESLKQYQEKLKYFQENPEELALAIIASPASCAIRLGLDKKNVKDVEDAFNKYFNKTGVKSALSKWMEEERLNVKIGILQYCAEGNLLAVLEEWQFISNDSSLNISELEARLGLEPSTVHLQTLETSKDRKDGIEKRNSFADRLTFDENDNGGSASSKSSWHENMQKTFNSPFWPMVLFAGRGAQEGLDFHSYCHRIMHLTLPKGAVSFDQRQGRIDRFRSLLVRRRVAKLFDKLEISGDQRNLLLRVFATLKHLKRENKILIEDDNFKKNSKNALYPDWMVPDISEGEDDKINFERIVPIWDASKDKIDYNSSLSLLNSYRASFGSNESLKEIGDLLLKREKDGEREFNIANLLVDLKAND